MRGDQHRLPFLPVPLKDKTIWALESDRDGNIWVGLLGGGIARLYRGTVSFHHNPDRFASRSISALLEDREGSIWVGASGAGLARFRDVPFHTLTTDDGLGANLVQTVLGTRDGKIWVGLNGGGITRLSADGRYLDSFTRREGLSSDDIFSLTADRDGNVWAGTFGGDLNRINRSGVRVYDGRDGLPNSALLCLLPGRDGGLWIGTMKNGLLRMRDGKVVRAYRTGDGLSSNQVRVIHYGPRRPALGRDGSRVSTSRRMTRSATTPSKTDFRANSSTPSTRIRAVRPGSAPLTAA